MKKKKELEAEPNIFDMAYIKEEERQNYLRQKNMIILVGFLMALANTMMSIVNVIQHSAMLLSTILCGTGFLLGGLLTWWTGKAKVGITIMCITVAGIFSWYAIVGGNNGFSILWLLLVPSISMLAFGVGFGNVVSLYFAVYLFALFYTPLKQILIYDYDSMFMVRFPLLYCIDMISSMVGFRITAKYQKENQQYKLKLLSYNDSLQKEVERQTVKIENFSEQLIESLAKTIDAKDKYTNGHSVRVAKYSRMLAAAMGKSPREQKNIYNIGMLHDIGKISISDEIINKTSKLTEEEFSIIKSHPKVGADILESISEMPEIAIGAKYHHERYDGRGYPQGLKGEDIPEIARIIGVADAYDAMASNRSYRKTLPQEEVRKEIEKGMGTQFDPKIAKVMLKLIDEDINYEMREH